MTIFLQGLFSDFDDIVLATSSGGTFAGLAIANYLTGEKLRVHGICVSDNADYIYEHVEQAIDAYRIRSTKTRKICDIIDGYKGTGYAKMMPEDQGRFNYFTNTLSRRRDIIEFRFIIQFDLYKNKSCNAEADKKINKSENSCHIIFFQEISKENQPWNIFSSQSVLISLMIFKVSK